jgi:enoyl-CoA hydratase/carnithine racemase
MSLVETTTEGRVRRLTLNRPEKRNALSAAFCQELTDAIETADADSSVGAILLTANGSAFCAGMDLAEVRPELEEEINREHERLFLVGTRIGKPLIAAVEGAALGGGMGIVANCHIVVAAETATFGLTEIRLGLWPFLVYRPVETAIGERRTVELALTGRIFEAPEAWELGLVHEVAADAAGRALAVAQSVAAHSPTAIRAGLAFLNDTRGRLGPEAAHSAQRFRKQVFASPDFREGIQAFREKRPPRWNSI